MWRGRASSLSGPVNNPKDCDYSHVCRIPVLPLLYATVIVFVFWFGLHRSDAEPLAMMETRKQ